MKTINKLIPIAPIIISIIALGVSIKSCSISHDINAINAEVQWSNLIDKYRTVDNKIRHWEESKGLKRNGEKIKNSSQFETYLNKLIKDFKASDQVIGLYQDRFSHYESLVNTSEKYEKVKYRLSKIDFKLPSPPEQAGFPYTLPAKLE